MYTAYINVSIKWICTLNVTLRNGTTYDNKNIMLHIYVLFT